MNYLLDTQAFFWAVQPKHTVPPGVAEALQHAERVVVSDISAFEVALKVRLGKLDNARPLVDAWSAAVAGLDGESLGVGTEHAIVAGGLEWSHRDPFDRLIVGQAIVEGLTLVTSDRVVQRAPGVQILAW